MFHVNTETGETGRCRAQKEKCPYGGETGFDNHFETKKAAQKAAERFMDNQYGSTPKTLTKKLSKISSNLQKAGRNLKPESPFTKKSKSLLEAQEKLHELKQQYAVNNSEDARIYEDGYEEMYLNALTLKKEIDEQEQKVEVLKTQVQAQVLADEEFLNITKKDKSSQTHKERLKASQRIKEFALTNPSEWKTGQNNAKAYTKRKDRPEYIDSIDKKHITSKSAGSKFTSSNIKKAEDVLVLALAQRGNLKGDGRDKLIKSGASPEAFLPVESGVRYLQVKTDGTEAIKDTATMKDSDVLTVVAKGRNDGKPSSLSFSVEVSEQPTTDYATVIIVPDMDENKKPIPNTEVLWTMHPGTPTRGIRSETIRENGFDDGDKITVGELRKRFGKDIKVNTKLI